MHPSCLSRSHGQDGHSYLRLFYRWIRHRIIQGTHYVYFLLLQPRFALLNVFARYCCVHGGSVLWRATAIFNKSVPRIHLGGGFVCALVCIKRPLSVLSTMDCLAKHTRWLYRCNEMRGRSFRLAVSGPVTLKHWPLAARSSPCWDRGSAAGRFRSQAQGQGHQVSGAFQPCLTSLSGGRWGWRGYGDGAWEGPGVSIWSIPGPVPGWFPGLNTRWDSKWSSKTSRFEDVWFCTFWPDSISENTAKNMSTHRAESQNGDQSMYPSCQDTIWTITTKNMESDFLEYQKIAKFSVQIRMNGRIQSSSHSALK